MSSIITAIGVGTAVSVGAGLYESSKATGIANQQLNMSKSVFGEQQGFESQLANLVNNPSSVTSLPGYQFQLDQGSDTVAREMAAGGFLNSGTEAAGLTQYGQGQAQSAYQQQVNVLSGLAGITAPTSATSAASGASGTQNNNFNQLSSVLASLGYGGYKLGSATGLGGSAGPNIDLANASEGEAIGDLSGSLSGQIMGGLG